MDRSGQIDVRPRERSELEGLARHCTEGIVRLRALIVLRSAEGWSRPQIAKSLSCSLSLISRVRRRWREDRLAGLDDRRAENGVRKASDDYAEAVKQVLEGSPRDYGQRRPTWTLKLIIKVVAGITGIWVSTTTMSRLLRSLRVRRGRPKPKPPQVWPRRAIRRRVREIRRFISRLPADEACVWEDEADIDLNPRIGPDWMLPGTQREVVTPGKNVKRYVAAAMDARTDRLTWVTGGRKNSDLFIELLKKLLKLHADKKMVHVILDNYVIHSSKRTRKWLAEHGERIRLHFLPPYCPDDNRIERSVFREMHANVTCNHVCTNIRLLTHEVICHFAARNRRLRTAAVAELRQAI